MRYVITPAGEAGHAQLSREFFLSSLESIVVPRERMTERLTVVVKQLEAERVLYGAGNIAAFAYMCLQEMDIDLVGVVDPAAGPFFRQTVHPPTALAGEL